MSAQALSFRPTRRVIAGALSAVLFAAVLSAPSISVAGGPRPVAPSRGDAIVELGRRLFFDPAVSRSGDNSCASCHEPDHGFSSKERFNDDDFLRARRHSQPLLDLAGGRAFHSDGEFDSISELVALRLGEPSGTPGLFGRPTGASSGYGPTPTTADPRPSAFPTAPTPAGARLPASTPTSGGTTSGGTGSGSAPTTPDDDQPPAAPTPTPPPDAGALPAAPPAVDPVHATPPTPALVGPGARERLGRGGIGAVAKRVEADGRYDEAFGAAYGAPAVSTARIADSIAAFVESIRSTTAPYDRFVAGETSAFDASERRGLALFKGRAGCAQCHVLGGVHAPLTDREFHNTGVARRAVEFGANPADVASRRANEDRGLAFSTTADAHEGQFKTPTLRDVALRAPYMHDGSFETLESVVRYYANGAHRNERLDRRIRPFDASTDDVNDLAAFLRSLTGSVRPGRAPDFSARADATTVRILDAAGHPIPGLRVSLESVGDRLPGAPFDAEPARAAVTDARGALTFAPSKRTHTRVNLPDGLRAPQGAWVPDTCKSLEWTLPIEGRTSLLLILPAGSTVAPRLGADVVTRSFPDAVRRLFLLVSDKTYLDARKRVATYELVGSADVAGKLVARYTAWKPTDAPDRVSLILPTLGGRTEREAEFLVSREARIDLTAGTTPR